MGTEASQKLQGRPPEFDSQPSHGFRNSLRDVRRVMGKAPAIQFYIGDWMKDPELSMCSPSTRGIWIDLLCAMHELDHSGQITGTITQLCRLCRCTVVEMSAAIEELKSTKAANVTERNGNVTVENRRMRKEYKVKENSNLRVKKHRGSAVVTALKRKCNAPSSSSSSVSISNTQIPVSVNSTDLGAPPGEVETHSSSILEYFQQKHVSKLRRQTNLYDSDKILPKLHALVRTHGGGEVKRLIDLFFAEDRSKGDSWIQRADYSFSVFASQAERLSQGPPKGSLTSEEIAKRAEEILAGRKKESEYSGVH